MASAGTRLVPYSQVCAYLQKTAAQRDKLEAARRLGGERRFLDVVTKRVLERGSDLSREEFLAASVLQPVLELDYMVAAVDHSIYVRKRERELLELKVVRSKHHETLRRYWRSYYAAGHLLTLGAMNGGRGVPPDLVSELGLPLRAVFALGPVYLGARALWAAARIGKPALPLCKQACSAPESDMDWLFGFLGLAVLAARHSKLRGEATKALDRSLKELSHRPRSVLAYVARLSDDFFPGQGRIARAREIGTEHARDPAPGPNAPCPCGSDRKYKRCCAESEKGSSDGSCRRTQRCLDTSELVRGRTAVDRLTRAASEAIVRPGPSAASLPLRPSRAYGDVLDPRWHADPRSRRMVQHDTTETKTYTGGCHCGKVRYRARVALREVTACNCSKTGTLLTFIPAEQFTLLSGGDAVVDYQFGKKQIHHLFCSTCGIRSFSRGAGPGGHEMYAINARCLDDVDLDALEVGHFDGKSL